MVEVLELNVSQRTPAMTPYDPFSTIDLASKCAYFWAGIAVGVKTLEESSDWAFDVIAGMDAPPIEIIEIATAQGREDVMRALKLGATGADWQAAGRSLLMDTRARLLSGEHNIVAALWISMKIVDTTDLPRDLMMELDLIEDAVNMISAGMLPAEQLQNELAHLLLEHGTVRMSQ